MHARGLKFGLYSDAGTYTCDGRPGSLGYEKIDAQTCEFYVGELTIVDAEWGVDYLKVSSVYLHQ